MKIYLTRHGETVWNVRDWVQGMTDIPLNDIGIRQAEKLAEEMADIHLAEFYTSQLQLSVRMPISASPISFL